MQVRVSARARTPLWQHWIRQKGSGVAISEKTIKVLWTRARNRCAYPSCPVAATNELTDAESGEVFVTPGLEQAHIRSKSEDGPRFDPEYPKDKLDSYENLILLCGAHHTPVVDAEGGRAFTAKQLEKMKTDHEANHQRLEDLEDTINKYLGEQYSVDDKVLFEQVELRGPTVESMFVDVPFTCRNDVPAAEIIRGIAERHPGDRDAVLGAPGQPVAGAAQALLSADWHGNALLVGGPGQGKSTLLQYVCQVHRARVMNRIEYNGQAQNLDLSDVTIRLPIRIDLRKYAGWARKQAEVRARNGGKGGQGRRPRRQDAKVTGSNAGWPTIEEFVAHDITTRAASGKRFTVRDLGTLISTRPVLIALDGLDEVADLEDRETVSTNAVRMNGRLQASSTDLIVLIASRPGGTTPQLWSSAEFPRMDLLPLSRGLRIQYLGRWCDVAKLGAEETERLQKRFLDSEGLAHIKDLASYPMQLAILLHLLHRRQLLPERRTELYDEYFKTFLDREQAQFKEPLLATDRPLVASVHAFLGWYIHTETEAGRAAGAIKKAELKRQLRVFLADRENGVQLADKLFAAMTTRMLCLVERQDDGFQFDVQTLREYFAAVYLFEEVDRDKRDQCLKAMLRRPYWSNVLRFFAGRYSNGEVRGIKGLLQELGDTPTLGNLPQLRATAAQLLADRAYHSQTSHPIQDIVDYILEGNGVVLGEDGLLDSSNGHLLLSEGAGRSQAVVHLKKRIEGEQSPAMTEVLARSLARHSSEGDEIAKWAANVFSNDVRWLTTAAQLKAFSVDLPNQDQRIANTMAEFACDRRWPSELLANGGYQSRDDPVVSAIVADLNDGAVEVLAALRRPSPVTPLTLARLAMRAQGRRFNEAPSGMTARSRTRQRAGSHLFGDIVTAARRLGDRPASESSKEWAARFDGIATTWGDGWILHRAIATTPLDVDLGAASELATDERAFERLKAHRAMREARGEPDTWATRINDVRTDVERALLAIDILTYGHVSALTENSTAVNALFASLTPKHFTATEAVLRHERRSRWGRLFIGDSVRRNRSRFAPRVLWLMRFVASESSLDYIDQALSNDVNGAVLDIGGANLRAPVARLSRHGKFKFKTFKGLRPVLPAGGWVSDVGSIALSKADYTAVLSAPLDWPADVVHLAVQKATIDQVAKNKQLQQVALDEEWIPLEP